MKTLSLNSQWLHPLCALVLLALGSLCPVTGFAQSNDVELSIVAMTGQPAPGTDYHFSTFAVPVISHDGTIAFGGSDFGGGGVWVQPKGGNLYGLALPGTDSPWTFPNSDPPIPFQYGVGGTLFYLGDYNRIVASGPEGLVFSDAGADPTIYLDTNTVPQLGTTIGSSLFPAFNQFRFQSGAVVPTMYLQGPDVDHNVQALYRYENQTLTEIARSGDPSATGTTNSFDEQNPFPVFVVSPQGDLVVHAIYYLDLDTLLYETGIYYDKGDGLKLLVRNGSPFPTNIANGPILLEGGGNGTTPQAPSISDAGLIVFKAERWEIGQPVQTFILQGSMDTGKLTALVRGGDTIPVENATEATINDIEDRPVVNKVGEVYFRAYDHTADGDLDALWRIRFGRYKLLVEEGEGAEGTEKGDELGSNALFSGFPNWVVNAEGRVAVLASLKLDAAAGVTPTNNIGLWVQDDNSFFAFVARTGSDLKIGNTNFGTITSIEFATNGRDATGNNEGIPSGLSDNRDVVFLVSLNNGKEAIVRASVNRGRGSKYFWSSATLNDQWFGKLGRDSNWEDENGVIWSDPPGRFGTEQVTIDGTDLTPDAVVLSMGPANIGKLTEKGSSLDLRQDLSLAEDSSIEDLKLEQGAHLSLKGKLTLQGTQNVLDGAVAAQSTVEVQSGGKLILNDSGFMVANKLILDAGAELSGRLRVTGTIVNSGSFSPGDSSGTAVIQGDYEQTATGSLKIQLDSSDPGTNYDRLTVGGVATLGGTLDLSMFNGFQNSIQATDTFAIVASANPIAGTFANVANGGRLVTAGGEGSFVVNYGSSSAYGPYEVVLSDYRPQTRLITPTFQTNGAFSFLTTGPAGQTNVIEASTNLQTWVPLVTNGTGVLPFMDNDASNHPMRFYRTRQQ